MTPLTIAVDRSMTVPRGHIVRTAHVPVHQIKLGNDSRIGVGDVERAYQKRLQCGDGQPWPCPNGEWDGEWFVIHDGRHEYIATLMLGFRTILVAWTEAK